jgi:hypothetical protein
MNHTDARSLKIAITVTIIIMVLLTYLPAPAFSQQDGLPKVQNLIVNGGFEGGFQEEFGIGYGWGGFSNGNAVVAWRFDGWQPVVAAGEYSQSIEIKDALSQDRYAGIYQTIPVVPGEQYKLTIKGLIRSDEGSIELSDYGYRLQYAIDYEGGTAWELVSPGAWAELPWDEQPLAEPEEQTYQLNTFEKTITAQGDELTLFVRGWKKWINQGTGIFNLDEISFVGQAPDGFQAPVAQAAAVESGSPAAGEDESAESMVQAMEPAEDSAMAEEAQAQPESVAEMDKMEGESEMDASTQTTMDQTNKLPMTEPAPLPVSGLGSDGSMWYVIIFAVATLLILLAGAITATVRQRRVVE